MSYKFEVLTAFDNVLHCIVLGASNIITIKEYMYKIPSVKEDEIDDNILSEIIEKLISDNYVRRETYGFVPTIEGRLLDKEGGYTEKWSRNSLDQKRMMKIERNTYRATFWMAFGAIGLLLIEIIKLIYKEKLKQ